jgi:hypothetical protein
MGKACSKNGDEALVRKPEGMRPLIRTRHRWEKIEWDG